jgi:hypothetical protein
MVISRKKGKMICRAAGKVQKHLNPLCIQEAVEKSLMWSCDPSTSHPTTGNLTLTEHVWAEVKHFIRSNNVGVELPLNHLCNSTHARISPVTKGDWQG